MTSKGKFYIVQEDILPESILKTVKVKELLMTGEASTVNEAVLKINISRSAYYKYKDSVFPMNQWNNTGSVNISMLLDHRAGVLSSVLNALASMKGNVITINQDFPAQGMAAVNIYIETINLRCSIDELVDIICRVDGVKNAVATAADSAKYIEPKR